MVDEDAMEQFNNLPAPSRYLAFPAAAHITAVELLTFLPNSIRCHSFVYRIVSNGFTRHAIWSVVNNNRDFAEQPTKEWCGGLVYKAMRDAGYEKWTFRVHDGWHERKKDTWDESNLDVTDFETPKDKRGWGHPGSMVDFRSLADGVRNFPTGFDALDLTRMVQHAVEHSEQSWMYPRDYHKLLAVVGGAMEVEMEHTDPCSYKRLDGRQPARPICELTGLPPLRVLQLRQEDPQQRTQQLLRKKKIKRRIEEEEALEEQNNDIAEGDEMETNNEPENEEEEQLPEWMFERDLSPWDDDFTGYMRGPPQLARPPVQIHTKDADVIPGPRAVQQSYPEPVAEQQRSLVEIPAPHPDDISGYAENLRWVAEQHKVFGPMVMQWNGSAEHVELIAQHRVAQLWVSDEWLQDRERSRDANEEVGRVRLSHKLRSQREPSSFIYQDKAADRFWDCGLGSLPPAREAFFDETNDLTVSDVWHFSEADIDES
jgi:hypothetical protein